MNTIADWNEFITGLDRVLNYVYTLRSSPKEY